MNVHNANINKMQPETVYFAPGAATWLIRLNIRVVSFVLASIM